MFSKLIESIPFKHFKTQIIVSLPFFLICRVYFVAWDSCLFPALDCVSSTATASYYFLFLGVFYYLWQPAVIFRHESRVLFLAGVSGHFLSSMIFYCLFVPVVIFCFQTRLSKVVIFFLASCFIASSYQWLFSVLHFIASGSQWSFTGVDHVLLTACTCVRFLCWLPLIASWCQFSVSVPDHVLLHMGSGDHFLTCILLHILLQSSFPDVADILMLAHSQGYFLLPNTFNCLVATYQPLTGILF